MRTYQELLTHLRNAGVLKTDRIAAAFAAADRQEFVPPELKDQAYVDAPLPIGHGQTISQPHTVAFMMELLAPQPGQKVLDVGFGSGWTTAILANAVGAEGEVYAMEILPEIFEFGKSNLDKFNFKNVFLFNRSGWEGLPEKSPFDRILVSAASPAVPEALRKQLKVGGRLVIPVGKRSVLDYSQSVVLLEKTGPNQFRQQAYPGFAFVPLVK